MNTSILESRIVLSAFRATSNFSHIVTDGCRNFLIQIEENSSFHTFRVKKNNGNGIFSKVESSRQARLVFQKCDIRVEDAITCRAKVNQIERTTSEIVLLLSFFHHDIEQHRITFQG